MEENVDKKDIEVTGNPLSYASLLCKDEYNILMGMNMAF